MARLDDAPLTTAAIRHTGVKATLPVAEKLDFGWRSAFSAAIAGCYQGGFSR